MQNERRDWMIGPQWFTQTLMAVGKTNVLGFIQKWPISIYIFSHSSFPLASLNTQTHSNPHSSRMSKVVTLEELKKHTSKDSLYVLLHEKGVSESKCSCL